MRIFEIDTSEIGDEKTVLACQEQLNAAKRRMQQTIDNKNLNTWSRVTRWYELSPFVVHAARGTNDIPMDASNAFFKAVELFHFIGLHARDRLFDNASLPGDFIRAARWITSNANLDWRASSLVGGLDDRYHVMRDSPDRWLMDEKMNGDVTQVDNYAIVESRLGDWRPTVYTSDLGFGPKDYYAEESEHYAAHLGQTAMGLRLLAAGGTMILKTFNMFQPESHAIVSHLCGVFAQVNIVKPGMSKRDNSECYIVAHDYSPDAATTAAFTTAVREKTRLTGTYNASVARTVVALTATQSETIDANCDRFTTHGVCNMSAHAHQWIKSNIIKARATCRVEQSIPLVCKDETSPPA